jgi:hypothetical protein
MSSEYQEASPTLVKTETPNRRSKRAASSNKKRPYKRFVSGSIPDHDGVVGAEAISALLNVSPKWVYDNQKELGLKKIGQLLFGVRQKLLEMVGGA